MLRLLNRGIKRAVWLLRRFFAVRSYTVGTAVIVVNAPGEILAVKRQWWLGGDYVLPGGGLEKGEDFEAAAIRELKEETGIHVERSNLGERHFVALDDWKDIVCTFIVDANRWSGEIKVGTPREIERAEWISIKEAKQILCEEDFALLKPFLYRET
jgi:8-oxo-dGTP pyrophosphatase MutT (NUDIX family)